MRLVRLSLERYGHVSGEALEFTPDRGLHVVLGANEAGKSTALEALSDGLFGFSTKESRKYQHPDDPRIGFTLRAADGTEASFVRRKTGREKLLDADGGPLTEAALTRFLGGTSRKRFREVFGLDGERLRQGGRTILTEHGEAGPAVLEAQTGLHNLREVVGKLDAQARELFGTAHGVRRITREAGRVKDLRRLMEERSLSGVAHGKEIAAEVVLSERLDAIQAEATGLRGEQARLQRTRRTTPVRRALSEAGRELRDIGPVPPLPADAAARRMEALARRDQALRDLERATADAALRRGRFDAIIGDPAILAEADSVTALAAQRGHIEEIERDQLGMQQRAEAEARVLDQTVSRLGVIERGAALLGRMPEAGVLRRADKLLRDRDTLLGKRAVLLNTLRTSEAASQAAEQAAAGVTPPEPAEALGDAIALTDREGAIEAALAAAEVEVVTASTELDHSLARLPLWTGDLARLEASSVPLEAEALRLGRALEIAAKRVEETSSALAANEAALASCRADIAGMRAAGAVPTTEAIAAIRARRDLAWRLIRRHHVEGRAIAGETDLDPAGLPDLLEGLLREADDLADRRGAEAIRVRDWEGLLADEGRMAAGHPGLVAADEVGRARLDAARATWRAAWASAGVEPLEPAAMREWIRAREGVLAMSRTMREARQKRDAIALRHARAVETLLAVLPEQDALPLASLRLFAARRLKALAAAGQAYAEAQGDLARARKKVVEDRRQSASLDAQAEEWRAAWGPVGERLGQADPDEAGETLELWRLAQRQLDAWLASATRVGEMAEAMRVNAARLAELAARLGEPVTDSFLRDTVARLHAAQAAREEGLRLTTELRGLESEIAGRRNAAEDAEAVLTGLRALAGAADDDALARVITAVRAHAVCAATIQARGAELHSLDDGRSEAELAAEAASIDLDAIPGRLAEIEQRLAELDAERVQVAADRADRRAAIQRMEAGQDVAGPAQEVQDALADIEDSAHRYVRVRLAHALLQAGIERFRRTQQGPLLAQASGLFAELTDGRYARLEPDEGDRGEPIIVAVRADNSTCVADHLSEGTRDQLFLALRLASIRLDAAAGEPLPFIADDLLVNFDDARAKAALRLLARFGQETQVVLFTHHAHLIDLVDPGGASLHRLPREMAAAA